MKNHIEELSVLLKAIALVRARWLKAVRDRTNEILADHPKKSKSEAFTDALMTRGDVHEEYQKLQNLYGLIGNDADVFSEALSEKPAIGKKAA